MENASKALLMAAGVLIGLLVLSLMVYLFVSFGSNSKILYEQIQTDRIGQFNSQFTAYENKEGVTIYDVITAANLATENNKYYQLSKKAIGINPEYSDYYVAVILQGSSIEYGEGNSSNDVQQAYNNLIANELTIMNHTNVEDEEELPQYKCITYTSNNTKRVYRVEFTRK